MLIVLGADHGGYELKEKVKTWLSKQNYNVVDTGAFALDKNDDFSKYVLLMRKCFDENSDAKIISFCSSGVGMSIGLNKHKGIKCLVAHTLDEVQIACQHNGINALSIGGKNTSFVKAKKMVSCFLSEKSLKGKYLKRMQDIEL